MFKAVDVVAFEAALARWAQATLAPGCRAIALDGKTFCGIHGEELPGCGWWQRTMWRPAWCWCNRGVRIFPASRDTPPPTDAPSVAATQNTDQASDEPMNEPVVEADAAHQAELTLAPAILAALSLKGRVVNGDALSCQRALCEQTCVAQDDYLFVVKANQPTVLAEVALLFEQPPPGETFAFASSYAHHSSRHEERRLWASAAFNAYLADLLGWPGIGQVLRLERVCIDRGQTTRQVRHLITSLPASVSAHRLLAVARGHWAIENRLHDVRDVTCGEDASTIRTGYAPHLLGLSTP